MPLQSGSCIGYKVVRLKEGKYSWRRVTKGDGSPQSPCAISADRANNNYTFTIREKGRDTGGAMRFFHLKGGWHILELTTNTSDYFYMLVKVTGTRGNHVIVYHSSDINCQSMSQDGTLQELGLKNLGMCVPNSDQVNLYGYFKRVMGGKLTPVLKIELEGKK